MRQLLFLLLFLSTPGFAQDFLDINLRAYHWNRHDKQQYNLNEDTPGLGFERNDGKFLAMVGFYENSIRKESVYALAGYLPLQSNGFNVGVIGGTVSGYQNILEPVLGAVVNYQYKDIGFNIVGVPSVPKYRVYGFAGLQIRIKL